MKFREVWSLRFGSEREQEKTRRRLMKRYARQLGEELYSRHMVWKDQPYFKEARAAADQVEGIPEPRCFVLQSALRSIASIPGDVAECGVRQGRSAIFMLIADQRKRGYHLFDSFEGLSRPSEEDRKSNGAMPWTEGDLATDEAVARNNLRSFDDVHIYPGWIPQTLDAVSDKRFAFVHVDVDLYEPTRDALRFFWERLETGGMIVCDDYGSAHCPGARQAFDEFFAERAEGIVELPTGQSLVTKLS